MNLESSSVYSRKAIKRYKRKQRELVLRDSLLNKGRLLFNLPKASIQGICAAIARETGWSVRNTTGHKYIMLRRYLKNEKNFYTTDAWRKLRYEALKLYGRKCQCCGAEPPDVILHVDHIKPRSKYPDLELDIRNIQIMCEDCNLGKGNSDEIDYR